LCQVFFINYFRDYITHYLIVLYHVVQNGIMNDVGSINDEYDKLFSMNSKTLFEPSSEYQNLLINNQNVPEERLAVNHSKKVKHLRISCTNSATNHKLSS